MSEATETPAPHPKFSNATEHMDGLRNCLGMLIQDALKTIQGGAYGPPSMEELGRCGQYHALLEFLP